MFSHLHEEPLIATLDKDPTVDVKFIEEVFGYLPFNFSEESIGHVINFVAKKAPRIVKELRSSEKLLKLVFGLAGVVDEDELLVLQREFLESLMGSKASCVWSLIDVKRHSVVLIEDLANFCVKRFGKRAEKENAVAFVQVLYLLEDYTNAGKNSDAQFVRMLWKVMLALDKLDLLYIGVPEFIEFDLRIHMTDFAAAKRIDREHLSREGGTLRILLKLVFLSVKANSADACALLKYLLFREKSLKKSMKTLLGIKFNNKMIKRRSYSLLDLLFVSDCGKNQAARIEFFNKKVLKNTTLLLDSVIPSRGPKTLSMFENSSLLLIYVLGQIFKLIHFELLHVHSYAEVLKDAQNLQGRIDQARYQTEAYSAKFCALAEILAQLIKSQRKEALLEVLATRFAELVPVLREKRHSYRPKRRPSMSSTSAKLSSNKTSVIFNNFANPPAPLSDSSESSDECEERKEQHLAATVPDEDEDAGEQFLSLWSMFCSTLVEKVEGAESLSENCLVLSGLLLASHFFNIVQPCILMYTQDMLLKYDRLLAKTTLPTSTFTRPELSDRLKSTTSDLETRVRDKVCYLEVHRAKLECDERNAEIATVARGAIRRLAKELQCGTLASKGERMVFGYVGRKYEKVLGKCPLYERMKGEGRSGKANFGQFVKLRKSKDALGRMLKLKPMKSSELDGRRNFGYLAEFALKKVLVLRLTTKEQRAKLAEKNYMQPDFYLELVKSLFKVSEKSANTYKMPRATAGTENYSLILEKSRSKSSEEVQCTPKERLTFQHSDYFPTSTEAVNAEMITTEGAVFGALTLNVSNLSFRSPARRRSDYKHGAPAFSQIVRSVNKRWKFAFLKEVVVKRYNLLRQAVEIYFRDNSSVFLSFFSKEKLLDFLQNFQGMLLKEGHSEVIIVSDPEHHFEAKKYKEKWQEGGISNFEYLMLLNKYGGRSFNDINQYPIFPWIFSNYTAPSLDTKVESNYRELAMPIGGISQRKRDYADRKLEALLQEEELEPYQVGSHCMPGRVALNYLFRAEPFSSLILQFDQRRDNPARMFHVFACAWANSNLDIGDNKELIPELFYLPELFENSNKYSYGVRPDSNFAGQVRVDRVILPEWAKNVHEFIKLSSLGLEEKFVSGNIGDWIDLVFGEKQQDKRWYNMYKKLCDESYVKQNEEKITESNIAEIQEFGTNPIKLFSKKHPQQYEKAAELKALWQSTATQYELIKLKDFGTYKAIMQVTSHMNTIYIFLSDQTVIALERKALGKRDSAGFKPKKLQISKMNLHNVQDSKRVYLFSKDFKFILSCKHYNNSCHAVSSTEKMQVVDSASMINVVQVVDDVLLAGNKDGLLECWELKPLSASKLKWFACDLYEPITTLDANKELDVVAVGGLSGLVSLRMISTGKFVSLINPVKLSAREEFKLRFIRLSFRGYAIAVLSSPNSNAIVVTTINGVLVSNVECNYTINTIIVHDLGYSFIAGGSNGKLLVYDLISLKASKLLSEGEAIEELFESGAAITDIELLKEDKAILIATDHGQLFACSFTTKPT